MITVGSIAREEAAKRIPFLAERFSGRRKAIKEFTHRDPEFAFWIYPDGRLFNARDSHRRNVPRGYEHILNNEPDYGGFLRGRVASLFEDQLVVIYCREETLAVNSEKIKQFLTGISRVPVNVRDEVLVISDNGDI